MDKRKIIPAIVVEGKYDRIRLSSVVDAVIIVTNGFQIYKNQQQLDLLRHYAKTTGLVILTDADAAGFQIRGFLKGAINEGTLFHVYIPGIHGKERRKTIAGKEGLLGVEGMDNQILLDALERAGLFNENLAATRENDITPSLLYEYGLMGSDHSADCRRALLESLRLPPHLSVNGLCEVLGTMTTAADFPAFLDKYLDKEES